MGHWWFSQLETSIYFGETMAIRSPASRTSLRSWAPSRRLSGSRSLLSACDGRTSKAWWNTSWESWLVKNQNTPWIWLWVNTETIVGWTSILTQLFWCEQKGYYWFWHTAKTCQDMPSHERKSHPTNNTNSNIIWLVVWNMNFMTFHSVGNVIIPADELIFFRGVETTNQIFIHIFHMFFFPHMCSYFSMFSWAKCFWTMFDFAAESTNLRNPEPHLWQASATSGAWGLETLASLRILAVFVGCVSHEFHRGSSGIIGARWDLRVTRFFWTQRLEACVIYCISTSFCGEFAQTVHFRDSCWPS